MPIDDLDPNSLPNDELVQLLNSIGLSLIVSTLGYKTLLSHISTDQIIEELSVNSSRDIPQCY